jgi:hypothetical protein
MHESSNYLLIYHHIIFDSYNEHPQLLPLLGFWTQIIQWTIGSKSMYQKIVPIFRSTLSEDNLLSRNHFIFNLCVSVCVREREREKKRKPKINNFHSLGVQRVGEKKYSNQLSKQYHFMKAKENKSFKHFSIFLSLHCPIHIMYHT